MLIMIKTLGETISLIETGVLLHISASGNLLKKLPQGNWIGGSTEFFITPNGGLSSADLLEVFVLPHDTFKIIEYSIENISNLAQDTYENGFSLVIIPSNSDIHNYYALNARFFPNIYEKNIVGWISGAASIYSNSKTLPIVINGLAQFDNNYYSDKAVVLHVSLPTDKVVRTGIINIFKRAENSPVFNFYEDGFNVKNCLINGKNGDLANYLLENCIDLNLPLLGEQTHINTDVNISIGSIENGTVKLHSPVFKNINYRISKEVIDYASEFIKQTAKYKDSNIIFNCNCLLNYFNGDLEGKDLGVFYGPVCYGEIAGNLYNQTLVFLEMV